MTTLALLCLLGFVASIGVASRSTRALTVSPPTPSTMPVRWQVRQWRKR